MEKMFCYQCEQTAKGTGCTMSGVCGKTPEVSHEQDVLTTQMVALAKSVLKLNKNKERAIELIIDGLFMTITNANFDGERIKGLTKSMTDLRGAMCNCVFIEPEQLFKGDNDIVSLRSTLLFGLRGMAAYAHHARILGKKSEEVDNWFLKGMSELAETHTVEEWLGLLMEFGAINYKCLQLLDEANTTTYGNPVPVEVPLLIEKGPFIVVTGHDLRDLKMLLEQTDGKGVNIYTHSEMLPAHGYPLLKKHPQLKGNFGVAWQNQQREFDGLPAAVLFTTNCLLPPKSSYKDNIFTTSIVGFEGVAHIEADENGHKDFSKVIEKAIELGGFKEDRQFEGINGGKSVMTGFGRQTVLDNAGTIIDAIKAGAIKHFFLVGGCDGVRSTRSYYTDFVKNAPSDTMILTLACGKYRFNDLDIGKIGPFPRILDMGQCNDSYGAVQVALALANAFECGVNDLPLTLVLSWFEQKAVCILLTLLSLGVKNIYIGPSIPAFFSDAVVDVLVKTFGLTPISTPQEDLKKILAK